MLEIILLIFMTRHIGSLAIRKGLQPGTWKQYTILSFLAGEMIGCIIGVVLWGKEEILAAAVLGVACAVAAFFTLRANLSSKPDADDDISNIGRDIHR